MWKLSLIYNNESNLLFQLWQFSMSRSILIFHLYHRFGRHMYKLLVPFWWRPKNKQIWYQDADFNFSIALAAGTTKCNFKLLEVTKIAIFFTTILNGKNHHTCFNWPRLLVSNIRFSFNISKFLLLKQIFITATRIRLVEIISAAWRKLEWKQKVKMLINQRPTNT